VGDRWLERPSLTTPTRWVHAFTGGLIWPLVVGILGRFRTSR